MHSFLSTIGAYPHAVLLVVFLVACAESIAIVGILVPAAIVMFSAGAMIEAGSLELWVTLAVAALGAVIGDGLSYEIGRAREAQIRTWRVLEHYRNALTRGDTFIRKHGGKSILLARFTAPVRAFVPMLAGFAHMPRARFYPINVVSALLWAPAHILPGVLFGASLQMAEAVSGRLAIILLVLVVLIWFAAWLIRVVIRFGVPRVRRLRDAAVAGARGRDTRCSRMTLALLDPNRPGSHALLLATALLLGAGWLFLGVLEGVLSHEPLVQVDLAVFHFLQGLRTSSVDRLMVAVTEMGGVGVLLPLAIIVTLWLVWRRCRRTAWYWVGAVAFGEVLVQVLKFTLGRRRPLELYTGVERFSFPSGHAAVSTVMLGFLAFLLSRRQSLRVQTAIAPVASVYVMLVAFSRLYLGAHWLSDVLGAMSLGLAWVALVTMVYTQRRIDEDFAPRGLMLLVVACVGVLGSVWIDRNFSHDLARYTVVVAPRSMTPDEWLDGGWHQIPARRIEMAGEPEEPFELQWAGSEAAIRARLSGGGWRLAAPWSLRSALQWLAPSAQLRDLPVLPRFDRGIQSRLAFVRWTAQQPNQRAVLRLWRSDLDLQTTGAGASVPIWYGAIYREVRRQSKYVSSLGLRQSIVPASGFEEQLPGDVKWQVRSRVPGKAQTILALPE